MRMLQGIATKEIFFNGQTYRNGDRIVLSEKDMRILESAGVAVGDYSCAVVDRSEPVEQAVVVPPENAVRVTAASAPSARRSRR